ncbi:MAG: DMT family transporter [Planctomycetota bacterium]
MSSASPLVGTVFALGSLGFAAINDLVFRVYAKGERRTGAYIAVIGATWLAVFGFLAWWNGTEWDTACWLWGAVVGVAGAVANILLVESMARAPAGIASTIYRLNLVPAAVLAVCFLDESADVITWTGIGLAIAAVAAFGLGSRSAGTLTRVGLILVVTASLTRAVMGFSIKVGKQHHAADFTMLAIAGLMWVAIGMLWEFRSGTVTCGARTVRFGLLSGGLTAGLICMLTWAMASGDVSQVLPISQMSFLLTAILAAVLLREVISRQQMVGLACGVAAIACLGWGRQFQEWVRHGTHAEIHGSIRTRDCVCPGGATARPIPAQGNALGISPISGEPCRGDPMERPYRAFVHASHVPGRCPGLGWVGPLALPNRCRVPVVLACAHA